MNLFLNGLSPHIFKKGYLAIGLFLLLGLAIGCGPVSSGGEPGRAQLELPTARPTVAPSPVSTRVLAIGSLTPAPTGTITPIPEEVMGLVVEVIDGDTVVVVLDGDPMRLAYEVRYLGIDAPPRSPESPWGVVAYETNRRQTNLKVVRLVRDETDFDAEGYLLRYVYVGDQLINTLLVEQGLAQAALETPDLRFETEITQAETAARTARAGIWSGQTPTPTPGGRPTRAATPTATEPPAGSPAETAAAPSPTAGSSPTAAQTGTATRTPTGAATASRTPTPSGTPTAASVTETPSASDLEGPS